MSCVWHSTPDPPPPRPAPTGRRETVPRPAHARLREALVEIYGLDEDCSDDAIVLAARMHAPC